MSEPKCHILYMEDDSALAWMVKKGLQRQGMDVTLASDGKQGLAMTTTRRYDVVIMDYRMPKMDGLSVLKALIDTPPTPPTILVSGTATLETAVKAMRMGASDYVIKESGENFVELLLVAIHRVLETSRLQSERQEALQRLKDSEGLLRSTMESTHDGILVVDQKGRISHYNSRFAEIWSIPQTLLDTKDDDQLLAYVQDQLADADGFLQRVGKLYRANHESYDIIHFKDGRIFERYSFPVFRDGKLSGRGWNFRDVTQRERDREALVEAGKRLDEAQRIAHMGHWDWDPRSGKLVWSEEVYRIFGLDSGHFTPSLDNFLALVHMEDRAYLQREIQRALTEPDYSYHVQFRHLRQDGTQRFISTQGETSWNANGQPFRLIGTAMDVTERVRIEEELSRAREQAEAANRMKSLFLASMSHEIRTPLTAILGMGELLLETELTEQQWDYLKISNNAGESLLAIINDILDLSKIEAGQLDLDERPFDLPKMVRETVEILTVRAQKQGSRLIVVVDPGLPIWVRGDPGRFRQVLLNLVGNATKFTQQGEILVMICTGVHPHEVRGVVLDTGVGISNDKLENIFEPFAQADAAVTGKHGGTGLGLTICRRLLQHMGGEIWAESQLGLGSAFHFKLRLPAVAFQEVPRFFPSVTQTDEHSHHSEESASSRAGLSILMAEDTEDNRFIIRSFLKNSPHHLKIVENGQLALEECKRRTNPVLKATCFFPNFFERSRGEG
ncbi:MAG: response regulator, partial [Magnetococcus sp. THC-1_WYH]